LNERVKTALLIGLSIVLVVIITLAIIDHTGLSEQAERNRLELAEGRRTIGRLTTELGFARGDIEDLTESNSKLRKENQLAQEIADQLAADLVETKRIARNFESTIEAIRSGSTLASEHVGSAREELRALIEELEAENN